MVFISGYPESAVLLFPRSRKIQMKDEKVFGGQLYINQLIVFLAIVIWILKKQYEFK